MKDRRRSKTCEERGLFTKMRKDQTNTKTEKKALTRTTTFSAKKTDQKCIAQFKQRHKGNVSDEIVKLIRRELAEHPERYQ